MQNLELDTTATDQPASLYPENDLFTANNIAHLSVILRAIDLCKPNNREGSFSDSQLKQWGHDSYSATQNIPTLLSSAVEFIFENTGRFKLLSEAETIATAKIYKRAKEIAYLLLQTSRLPSEHELEFLLQGIAARTQLTLGYMRFVVFRAKRYSRANYSYEDTLQVGFRGLLLAVEKFDPDKGIMFSTYADYWVKREMSRHRYEDTLVHIPLYLSLLIDQINKHQHPEEFLATLSQQRLQNVNQAITMLNTTDISSDKSDNDEVVLEETISDGRSPIENVLYQYDEEALQDIFEQTLTSREELIIKMLYGFGGKEPLQSTEAAKKLRLTDERIKQIRKQALVKLKSYYSHQGMKTYRESFEVI